MVLGLLQVDFMKQNILNKSLALYSKKKLGLDCSFSCSNHGTL